MDPESGTPRRTSNRPELDASDRFAESGESTEGTTVDEAETMASSGDASSSFFEVASGTATGLGIDRGSSTGTGGLAAGEDLDAVAEGDYWREYFLERPYVDGGKPYEHYEPGYRLGWEAATDIAFEGMDFEEAEHQLESRWLNESPRSWAEVRPAARDAWQRIRARPVYARR